MATGWDIAAPETELRPVYLSKFEALKVGQEVAWEHNGDHLIISHQSLADLTEENHDLRVALGRPLLWPA